MAKSGRLFFCLVVCVLMLAASSSAQTRPAAIEKVAKTYGIDSFDKVEAIRYTFNLEIPALKLNLSHAWEWEPKTGKVSFEGKGKDGKPVKVSYVRSQLASQPDAVKKEVDPAFVNDNYWLIFPFHAYWDSSTASGADITDQGMKKLPQGKGSARLVSVKYPSNLGGYTPGDVWDLYVGPDNQIKEFVFHHGGTAKPSLVIASWTGYKKAGSLLFSTEHRGTADGTPLHLWLSNVAVKLAGSDKWIPAQ